jgi:hypothetical protein
MKLFCQFCVMSFENYSRLQRFCNTHIAMLEPDVCSTYKLKLDLAGWGDTCSRLGLSDATVYVRKNHGFCFECYRRRAGRAAYDLSIAVDEFFARPPTREPPSYRSGIALYDLPAREVCCRHDRIAGRAQAGVSDRSHFDRRDLYGAFGWHRFGLQYIAADIASGFILLFERPIRIGDRITIGEDEGDVQSINLRTTVVTTNDRIAIIVPNSKLVGQRVVNWSYGDPRARISIPIGVADDSDIDLVTATLIQAAQGVANVLEEPKPRVQLLKFGDYSLDFRLLVWTNQPRRHVQIRSDINYRISRLFRERSIRSPHPTQEFLLKGIPRQLEPSLLTDNDVTDNTSAQRDQ